MSLIQAYYWATSIFVLLDLTLGANVRAAALPQAELRYVYYGLDPALSGWSGGRPSGAAA
jgi:hypothetical protein